MKKIESRDVRLMCTLHILNIQAISHSKSQFGVGTATRDTRAEPIIRKSTNALILQEIEEKVDATTQ